MPSGRSELIERLVETWNSGEVDRLMDILGPDFEFRPDPSFPDTGPYSGDDLQRWLHEWKGTWEGNRYEVLGIADHGPAVTIDSRWHLAAKGTGDQIPVQDFTLVLWFDDEGRRWRWPRSSIADEPSRRRGARLADWPVIACMLFMARLGCLKKPTE